MITLFPPFTQDTQLGCGCSIEISNGFPVFNHKCGLVEHKSIKNCRHCGFMYVPYHSCPAWTTDMQMTDEELNAHCESLRKRTELNTHLTWHKEKADIDCALCIK